MSRKAVLNWELNWCKYIRRACWFTGVEGLKRSRRPWTVVLSRSRWWRLKKVSEGSWLHMRRSLFRSSEWQHTSSGWSERETDNIGFGYQWGWFRWSLERGWTERTWGMVGDLPVGFCIVGVFCSTCLVLLVVPSLLGLDRRGKEWEG